jgi:hypothetical protein
MGDLLEWLLLKENRNICRGVGLFFLIFSLSFIFGGGFDNGFTGMIFSSGWYRGIFVAMLSFLFIMGIILTFAGFRREK